MAIDAIILFIQKGLGRREKKNLSVKEGWHLNSCNEACLETRRAKTVTIWSDFWARTELDNCRN
jgi:hypothetical protein